MSWAIAAILLGILLLVSEVFIPSGGLLMVFSLFFIGAGVVLIFYTPESEGGGFRTGIYTILGLLVLLPVLGGAAFYWWPYTPMGKAVMLDIPTEEEAAVFTEAQQAFEELRGQTAKTLTQHQPSGAIEVRGKRYESTTEGMFVDAGQLVRIISVTGKQLVVRPVTAGELQDLPSDLEA
ncbi:MAG TPA: NfeD family protein [Gemmatales bacterium]|nr:NfeD family protein [Gemmatales bacterium]